MREHTVKSIVDTFTSFRAQLSRASETFAEFRWINRDKMKHVNLFLKMWCDYYTTYWFDAKLFPESCHFHFCEWNNDSRKSFVFHLISCARNDVKLSTMLFTVCPCTLIVIKYVCILTSRIDSEITTYFKKFKLSFSQCNDLWVNTSHAPEAPMQHDLRWRSGENGGWFLHPHFSLFSASLRFFFGPFLQKS